MIYAQIHFERLFGTEGGVHPESGGFQVELEDFAEILFVVHDQYAFLVHDNALFEYKKYGQNHTDKGGQVIPRQASRLEDDGRENDEDRQGDDLLDDFELQERVGTAGRLCAQPVGRHLYGVLQQGDAPADQYDDQVGFAVEVPVLEPFQMAVPCQNHENVRHNEHDDGQYSFPHHRAGGLSSCRLSSSGMMRRPFCTQTFSTLARMHNRPSSLRRISW